jgi:hypothetical protein
MVVRLSALRAGRPLPPGRFLVLIFDRCWDEPRAIVRLDGLGKLKIPPHRNSIPRPSGLQHSDSTNYATACPFDFYRVLKCVQYNAIINKIIQIVNCLYFLVGIGGGEYSIFFLFFDNPGRTRSFLLDLSDPIVYWNSIIVYCKLIAYHILNSFLQRTFLNLNNVPVILIL